MAMAMALLALPAVSLANTYQFVDTSGNLQSVEANIPATALATAYQLGIHSGVILVGNEDSNLSVPTNISGYDNYYQFIDTSGIRQGLWAINSSMALDTSYQLAMHSGVILVN